MGSGSLAAMSVFETGYREDMGEAEAIGACVFDCDFAVLASAVLGSCSCRRRMETAIVLMLTPCFTYGSQSW